MVPPSSHRVSRVRRYSGFSWLSSPFVYESLTLCGASSHTLRLGYLMPSAVLTPTVLLQSVWPPPRSLAATCGISVDFFSSPYLDVSVQAVPSLTLCIHVRVAALAGSGVSPFGNPRINAYLQLPVAYRSLSRPSSAPIDQAFTLCSL